LKALLDIPPPPKPRTLFSIYNLYLGNDLHIIAIYSYVLYVPHSFNFQKFDSILVWKQIGCGNRDHGNKTSSAKASKFTEFKLITLALVRTSPSEHLCVIALSTEPGQLLGLDASMAIDLHLLNQSLAQNHGCSTWILCDTAKKIYHGR
jgi:hypothetical protein